MALEDEKQIPEEEPVEDVEEDEEEEEEEPEDVKEEIEEECASTTCAAAKEEMEKCEARVNSRTNTAETCTEELFHFLHCVDHCTAPKLWSHLNIDTMVAFYMKQNIGKLTLLHI
eukprot:Clim_evm56s203 gene=Clim_evmTU56s203